MKKIFFTTILTLFFLLTFGRLDAHAADINIDIDRLFTIADDGQSVNVRESRTVNNNTSNRIITSTNNKEVFSITSLYSDNFDPEVLQQMVSSVSVKNSNGTRLNYSVRYEDTVALIDVPYPSNISPGGSYEFVLEYKNIQLSSQVGALYDIYVQAFSEDFEFDNNSFSTNYKTQVRVPKSLGEENFVSPDPASQSENDKYDVYSFDQEQLLGNYVWIQRGTAQYYEFEIKQKLEATEQFQTGNKNEFRMIIPMPLDAIKVNQEVYFKSISPEPEYLERDNEGNIVGIFKLPSHLDHTITISGYAYVNSLKDLDITNSGSLSDLENSLDSRYLSSAEYWEVEATAIQEKANELKGDKTDVYTIISDTYAFIVDSIDYSQVKRFGLNERQGALKTLQGGAAVCMEYSDLYIALLRAQGIPARAAFGYGYDSKDPADQQELHQWVQVYLPNHDKWLNIDPTWGENGPALIGGDMNHFLTHTASINPNIPSTLSARTYGDSINFEPVEFIIETLAEEPAQPGSTVEEMLQKYQKPEYTAIESLSNNFQDRINAGINSFSNEGLNLKNSAQLTTIITGSILLFCIFVICSGVIKMIKDRSKKNSSTSSR